MDTRRLVDHLGPAQSGLKIQRLRYLAPRQVRECMAYWDVNPRDTLLDTRAAERFMIPSTK